MSTSSQLPSGIFSSPCNGSKTCLSSPLDSTKSITNMGNNFKEDYKSQQNYIIEIMQSGNKTKWRDDLENRVSLLKAIQLLLGYPYIDVMSDDRKYNISTALDPKVLLRIFVNLKKTKRISTI